MKRHLYRMLCDGIEEWRGIATDTEQAEEKCFWDEEPGSICRYTLQRWKQSRKASIKNPDKWITIYKNAALHIH